MKTDKNFIRRFKAFVCGVAAAAFLAVPASATALEESQIYKGSLQLFSDFMSALTVFCPIVCGVFGIYFLIRRGMADEQDGKIWTRRITTAVICGVGGMLIAGLIALVSSYYAGV